MKRKEKDEIVLSDKEILRSALQERGMTQTSLSKLLGIGQNALSASMSRDRMSVAGFKRILNELGYDIAVIDRENGEVRWVIDPES